MRATTPEARRYARWLFPTLSPLPPPPPRYMLRTPVRHLGKDGRFPACDVAGIKMMPGVDLLPLEQAGPEGTEQASLLKVGLQEDVRTAEGSILYHLSSPFKDEISYRDIAAVYSADSPTAN